MVAASLVTGVWGISPIRVRGSLAGLHHLVVVAHAEQHEDQHQASSSEGCDGRIAGDPADCRPGEGREQKATQRLAHHLADCYEALEQSGVSSPQDLQAVVPGFVAQQRVGSAAPSVRGIGSIDPSFASEGVSSTTRTSG